VDEQRPGYHQYFPASSIQIRGYSVAALISEFYSDVPLKKPIGEIEGLIDTSAITRAVGWAPKQPLAVELE
jgi:hypothetical protein